MTPGELFTQVGRTLFGDRWKADIEHALNIRSGRADDWSKGHGEPPPGIWLELARIIADRRKVLPALEAEVLIYGHLPPPRIYECANGRKFSVKADANGLYPEVYFQAGTSPWKALGPDERMIPQQATAFRLQRGLEIGHSRPIITKYCADAEILKTEKRIRSRTYTPLPGNSKSKRKNA